MSQQVTKIRLHRLYEMELEQPQQLTESQARELFREEENELDFLISETVELVESSGEVSQ